MDWKKKGTDKLASHRKKSLLLRLRVPDTFSDHPGIRRTDFTGNYHKRSEISDPKKKIEGIEVKEIRVGTQGLSYWITYLCRSGKETYTSADNLLVSERGSPNESVANGWRTDEQRRRRSERELVYPRRSVLTLVGSRRFGRHAIRAYCQRDTLL